MVISSKLDSSASPCTRALPERTVPCVSLSLCGISAVASYRFGFPIQRRPRITKRRLFLVRRTVPSSYFENLLSEPFEISTPTGWTVNFDPPRAINTLAPKMGCRNDHKKQQVSNSPVSSLWTAAGSVLTFHKCFKDHIHCLNRVTRVEPNHTRSPTEYLSIPANDHCTLAM